MDENRRRFLAAAGVTAASSALAALPLPALAQTETLPLPNPANFQSGDFVWPKKPGAFVPYATDALHDPAEDKAQWEHEKAEFLAAERARTDRTELDEARLQDIQDLTYREFLAVYEGAQEPGVPGLYAGDGVYVGHVGIIDVDEGSVPWVVEALWGKGVLRQTYADWIAGRPDQVVWHGRLRNEEAGNRAKIAGEARKHIGKPYKFWNFNLDDDAGFYCSKLVWLSVWRSLGIAIDGNEGARRLLWFSPKQLLHVPRMSRLHDPGDYAWV